jgi:hypothetical protein
MEIQIIGMVILFLVLIVVGVLIVSSFTSLKTFLPTQFKDVYKKVVTSIGFKSPFDVCESFVGQKISLQDFQTLLQALYNGQCASSHTNVSLSFSLTKSDLEKIAVLTGIGLNGKLIFYNMSSPLGIGALLIQGDPGQYPLKFEDFVDMTLSGYPKPDVLIKVTLKGCDPYDDICDVSCIFKKICDPVCDDGKTHNVPCNLACIDADVNGIDVNDTQQRVAQGKCNPDCYVNVTNPFKAFDPGCVWKYKEQKDDICDPNSNGVEDGVCDQDCLLTKSICDPDCNGTAYDGNPYGLNDTKCFICDGTCNGWCSSVCNKNAYPGDPNFDPDCYRNINASFSCSGDGLCESDKDENCANSLDCPGGGLTCGDYHTVCCPAASDADVSGCSNITDIPEGGLCSCGTQCATNQTCDGTGHCCPSGKFWNGTACSQSSDVLIVTMKSNMKKVYSDAQIQKLEDKVKDYINALGADGLGGTFLYLDDSQVSDITSGSSVPQNSNDPSIIKGVISQLIIKLKAKYLIILGGDQRVIQPQVGSRTGSDDPYGDTSTSADNIPDIPVGRIPDPNNGDLDVMLNTLDTASRLHRSGGLDLSDYVSPVMGCGGTSNGNWNSGRCFCTDVYKIASCAGKCGCLPLTDTNGKGFAAILCHGPGPSSSDLFMGGCINAVPSDIAPLNVKNAVWMTMSCGGGHLKLKATTSGSIMMTFLKIGGAVYFGSTDLNYGGIGNCPGSIPGGDGCIGTLYVLVAQKFAVGKRIGDPYIAGKAEYLSGKYALSNSCSIDYQGHINVLYGDPSLKITKMWSQ